MKQNHLPANVILRNALSELCSRYKNHRIPQVRHANICDAKSQIIPKLISPSESYIIEMVYTVKNVW